MRKLVAGYLTTVDGVHDDPMSWSSDYFDDAAAARALEQLDRSGGFLMGRGSYEYFHPSWSVAAGPYPDRINAMPKYVVSSTLTDPRWDGTTVLPGDPEAAVAALKREGAGDLVLYGFTRLTRTLLAAGLVDELTATVFPVVQGDGTPLLRPATRVRLRTVAAQTFPNGSLAVTYAPGR